MLSVRKLCKRYGNLVALDNVSFDVEAGEVVGFLGPNGAGKSTTMRIITGYIPASRGKATIDGLDTAIHSLEARRRIGYLPEHTPLYGDMRVREFLEYRARLKGVTGRDVAKRVDYVIERTWLQDRQRQLIETLSKGYRQRVGIADAMVGNPRLLILDEPTIGLDPNQIREVRKLLKELSESHTLLLSTHILSEVELVSTRVIMIARGKKVADDATKALLGRHRSNRLLARLDNMLDDKTVTRALTGLPEVSKVEVGEGDLDARSYLLTLTGKAKDAEAQTAVSQLVQGQGWKLHELTPERVTLEQIFVEKTGSGDAA